MGGVASTVYNGCRRILLRYNVENRAHKFIEKDKLPPPPRYPTEQEFLSKGNMLKNIHEKSEQLSEYLKKVYLTSTSTITGTESKRPLPKKENEFKARVTAKFFYEPLEPRPGYTTLTNMLDILKKYKTDPEFATINQISAKFGLNRQDVVNLLLYYSNFRKETLEFATRAEAKEPKSPTEPKTTLKDVEPARQIASK